MSDWLPESVTPEREMAGRIATRVSARVARRRRLTRAAGSAGAAVTVAALGVLMALGGGRDRLAGKGPETPPAPEILSVVKTDHSVLVEWEGKGDAEYTVYRCSSPRFDQCALSGKVKGTAWLDTAPGDGTITYYRVESKG